MIRVHCFGPFWIADSYECPITMFQWKTKRPCVKGIVVFFSVFTKPLFRDHKSQQEMYEAVFIKTTVLIFNLFRLCGRILQVTLPSYNYNGDYNLMNGFSLHQPFIQLVHTHSILSPSFQIWTSIHSLPLDRRFYCLFKVCFITIASKCDWVCVCVCVCFSSKSCKLLIKRLKYPTRCYSNHNLIIMLRLGCLHLIALKQYCSSYGAVLF